MNRVDPLREGSGERRSTRKIRRVTSEVVPENFREIIPAHQWLERHTVGFSLQKGPEDAERQRLDTIRVVDVEMLVLEAPAEAAEPRLSTHAPTELRAFVIETESE